MSSLFDAIRRQIGYVVSLPERTIRSLAAVVGGTTSLLTDTLFPEALRGTTLYRIFLGDTQRFLIEKIARIEKENQTATGQAADPAFVQKKLVGGALETAGLFAMHFSPLWVFAIAGDAAAGSSVFLDRLAQQLKSNGVIPLDASISSLTELLAAVQTTASRSAAAIDTPPLSREELGKLASEMTANYGRMFAGVTDLLPRFETLWGQMEKLAGRDNISIETLGGILTVDLADWAKKGVGAVSALGRTGTDLFGEMILDSYTRTLDAVAEEGVTGYVGHRMKPFLQAAVSHFDAERTTWTGSLVQRLLGRADEPMTENQTAS